MPLITKFADGYPANEAFTSKTGATLYRNVDSAGNRADLEVIQSDPTKAGRQRHVLRMNFRTKPTDSGIAYGHTATVTLDSDVKDPAGEFFMKHALGLLLGVISDVNMQTAVLRGQQ